VFHVVLGVHFSNAKKTLRKRRPRKISSPKIHPFQAPRLTEVDTPERFSRLVRPRNDIVGCHKPNTKKPTKTIDAGLQGR
jgi:hypothetical protein